MGYYSFVVWAPQPTGLIDPMVQLDTGVNVFTVVVENLEDFIQQLKDEGVEVRSHHRLDDHQKIATNDLLLSENSSALSGHYHEEEP